VVLLKIKLILVNDMLVGGTKVTKDNMFQSLESLSSGFGKDILPAINNIQDIIHGSRGESLEQKTIGNHNNNHDKHR
jgi:hypothetical protein